MGPLEEAKTAQIRYLREKCMNSITDQINPVLRTQTLQTCHAWATRRVNLQRKLMDLGDQLENIDEGVENLKNTKMKLFGITMTPTTIGAAFALVSTLLGSLYGGFEVYKDYMEMKEKLANLDVEAIEARNELIETKLDEAIEYTRDIKSGLRDDILAIEKQADRVEDMVRESENEVRAIVRDAEKSFDEKRDRLQSDYDTAASRLRDNSDRKIQELEERLNAKLQRALDNPLADG